MRRVIVLFTAILSWHSGQQAPHLPNSRWDCLYGTER